MFSPGRTSGHINMLFQEHHNGGKVKPIVVCNLKCAIAAELLEQECIDVKGKIGAKIEQKRREHDEEIKRKTVGSFLKIKRTLH